MKIKTFSEMEFRISADDLAALLHRAKQSEIMFAENMANQEKIVRLKKNVTDLSGLLARMKKEYALLLKKHTETRRTLETCETVMECVREERGEELGAESLEHGAESLELKDKSNFGKEVIKMPCKWTTPKANGRGTRPACPPKADKPKANKPKAAKPPKGDKKPTGEKEAK